MDQYRHILLAIDLLSDMEPSIKKAMMLAKLFSAKLSILHIVDRIPPYAEVTPINVEEEWVAYAKKELIKLADELHLNHSDLHIRIGAPKREIPDFASELKVDLIVLGSHGRHGIFPLLGSTANAVIHNAHCDVMTVRNVIEEKS